MIKWLQIHVIVLVMSLIYDSLTPYFGESVGIMTGKLRTQGRVKRGGYRINGSSVVSVKHDRDGIYISKPAVSSPSVNRPVQWLIYSIALGTTLIYTSVVTT